MPEPLSGRSQALMRLLDLKAVLRQGWTRFPITDVESVADHSYGVALLASLLCPDRLDREKVMEIALFHDLAEVVTGDLIPSDGVPDELKKRREREALEGLLEALPNAERGLRALLDYQQQASPEARFVKAIDKLEMALQSLRYERSDQTDLEEFRRSARPLVEASDLTHWLQ